MESERAFDSRAAHILELVELHAPPRGHGAALFASAGTAQARGGGHAVMSEIKVTRINTVSSGPSTVVRDHRGNHNGEGGVTVT